jgi:hypothetical protein
MGLFFNKVGAETPTPTPTIPTYERPSDWLPLPTLTEGDQRMVSLVSIFPEENSNLFTLRVAGNFTVNVYGLNNTLISTTDFASGVLAQYNLNYSDFPGTESTRGYRQAIIEIVPQTGANLTSIQLHERHSLGGTLLYSSNYLDIKVVGNNISTFTLRGAVNSLTDVIIPRFLEQFEYVGNSSLTSNAQFLFKSCTWLKNLIGTEWTSQINNMTNMFESCRSLQTIPALNTVSCTNFTNMLLSCRMLKTIPLINTGNGTNFTGMFATCQVLETIPLINTSNGTNFTSMFNTCSLLKSIPLLNTSNGTNFTSMFAGCITLETIPLINTGNGTNFTSMFDGCSNFKTLPLINTQSAGTLAFMLRNCISLKTLPLLNTTSVNRFDNLFDGCFSLEKVPLFNTQNALDVISMFRNCINLKEVPHFNFQNLTRINQMFENTAVEKVPLFNTPNLSSVSSVFPFSSIREIPAWNINAVTSAFNSGFGFSSSWNNLPSLQKISFYPIKFNFNMSNNFMGRNEIVEVFNNLLDRTGLTNQTITISGNRGVVDLTQEDRNIAINKNWTISG